MSGNFNGLNWRKPHSVRLRSSKKLNKDLSGFFLITQASSLTKAKVPKVTNGMVKKTGNKVKSISSKKTPALALRGAENNLATRQRKEEGQVLKCTK